VFIKLTHAAGQFHFAAPQSQLS